MHYADHTMNHSLASSRQVVLCAPLQLLLSLRLLLP